MRMVSLTSMLQARDPEAALNPHLDDLVLMQHLVRIAYRDHRLGSFIWY